ncbi:BMP family ABC transporter substrate-binding protein [Geodermatophilus sp. DF01-2]|uniref:BMP family lipoprotein n=1 Tax=Geodermatophilus sp. DF01-2 TaxID=2559610 RepID=UPI0010736EFE|nr:BMP family ABC transporter substrate-binding protein [Geodermatophilus sp. DF01_2]TFV56070.1 BMP family ABC transporter substrate-binding protein [Geodermatophilus sp. DF01_2]
MSYRSKTLVALSSLVAMTLTACAIGDGGGAGASGSENGGGEETIEIGLVQEARPDVEPWSLAWHNAVQEMMAEDSGIEVTETFEAYDATRAEPVIRQLLEGGADVMALSSFVLTDVAKTVATEYPDVPMVLTSFGEPQQPNLSLATASYLEIGYATCWLLTKLSDDGRIGYVGAQEAPFEVESLEGCELGASAANPAAEVTVVNSNSFTDVQANREQVQALLDQGITEIFLGSGTEDAVGGLRLCEQNQAHCATWGGDARMWAPTASVLTVILDWSLVLEDLVEQARTGDLEAEVFNLTFGNDGLQVTDFDSTDAVSPELQAEFQQVIEGLASEEITLPESTVHPGFR